MQVTSVFSVLLARGCFRRLQVNLIDEYNAKGGEAEPDVRTIDMSRYLHTISDTYP